jgi:hypothetical protein
VGIEGSGIERPANVAIVSEPATRATLCSGREQNVERRARAALMSTFADDPATKNVD